MDVVSQIVVKQSLLVENFIPATAITPGNRIKWPSGFLDKITGKIVYGIELVTATELAVSPNGRTVIPAADAANITFTMVEQQTNLRFIQQMPGTRLRPALYNGMTQYFKPRMIDFTQSEVQITGAGTLAANQAVLLNCYYRDATPEELKRYGRG